MLDKLFNPAPTIYKWDRFWVGFLPGLILPFIAFVLLYGIIALSAKIGNGEVYPFSQYLNNLHSQIMFLRITTLCCIPNALLFFLFIQRNYNNASRGVVLITMLLVIAIVIRDFS